MTERSDWLAAVERWARRAEAWIQRVGDRYECWIERRGPRSATRRGHVAYLRRSADETGHFRPRGAARDRRTADRIEREGLELAFRKSH